MYLYGSSVGQNFAVGSFTTETSLFEAIDNLALNSNNQNGRNVIGLFDSLDTDIENSGTAGPVIVVLFVTGSVDGSVEATQKAKEYRDSSNPNIYLMVLGIGKLSCLLCCNSYLMFNYIEKLQGTQLLLRLIVMTYSVVSPRTVKRLMVHMTVMT